MRLVGGVLSLVLACAGLAACAAEDPVSEEEVVRAIGRLAIVSEHELSCHSTELWQRRCDLEVTVTGTPVDELTDLLTALAPLGGGEHDTDVTVQLADDAGKGARRIEVREGGDPTAMATAFSRAVAVPETTAVVVGPASAVGTVEVSLRERLSLAAELAGLLAGEVRLGFAQHDVSVTADGDLADELAVATAVLADWRVEGVEQVAVADGSLLIRLDRPGHDAVARKIARAQPAYRRIASVEIGFSAGLDAPQPERVVRAVVDDLPGVMALDGGDALRVTTPDADAAVAAHRLLLDTAPAEYAGSRVVWEWSSSEGTVSLTKPRDGRVDLAPVMTVASTGWADVELRDLGEGDQLLFLELSPDATGLGEAERAGRRLREAGLADPRLRAVVYGGVLAGGLDLDVVDGELVAVDHARPVPTDAVAAFRRGWGAGAPG